MKNPLGKSRDLETPYATFTQYLPDVGNLELRVLKTRKLAKNEDNLAIWYTAGKSEATHGSWEYGDMYKSEITSMDLKYASPEFKEAYPDTLFRIHNPSNNLNSLDTLN